MEKDIYVFIVEDPELGQTLFKEHFNRGKITYAELQPASKRERIVRALKLA